MLILTGNEKIFETDEQQNAYEIVGIIDKLRAYHASFAAALSGIRGCIMASVYAREPENCMVLGEGGTGKTSLAQYIIKSMPPAIIQGNDLEISTTPAFYTTFKTARSLDALTTDVLIQLGDQHPSHGKPSEKAYRVGTLLKNCKTRIMFVDELHTLDSLEDNGEELIRWVKEITNVCGPIVCLMGLERCKNIFNGDSEMSRRFKSKFFLRALSIGTKEQQGQLPLFLTAICKEILSVTPIKSFPPLGQYEQAFQIWAATGGNPDFVMSLLKKAVLRTLLAGRYDVTMADLSEVWESGVLNSASQVDFNPFNATQAQLWSAIRKQRI